jgi:multidrug efflux pump subunit AcrA (membrane-fusion protein)
VINWLIGVSLCHRFNWSSRRGRFLETPVTPGAPIGDAVRVLGGVKPGDKVVADGSFFLRAEAARVRPSN